MYLYWKETYYYLFYFKNKLCMKYLKLADQFGASFQPYIGGDKDS